MDEEEFKIQLIAYLSGELEKQEQLLFETELEKHPERKSTYIEMKLAWQHLDGLENKNPSELMDKTFYNMLHTEMEKSNKQTKTFASSLQQLLNSLFKPQLAYGIVLLGIGLTAGYLLNTDSTEDVVEPVTVSNSETEEIREKLVLTLLEQPSANKRLQGVNEANKIARVDEKVIKALLQTLNHDPNVNVRLAAIESLTNYVDEPIVRMGLVQSIVQQDAPIVQVTLANLMVALQEKKSIAPFKTLIQSKELNRTVKKKIESSIQQII